MQLHVKSGCTLAAAGMKLIQVLSAALGGAVKLSYTEMLVVMGLADRYLLTILTTAIEVMLLKNYQHYVKNFLVN